MKFTIRGTVQPPRGTPGANGAYVVDLTIEIPDSVTLEVEQRSGLRAESMDALAAALPTIPKPSRKKRKKPTRENLKLVVSPSPPHKRSKRKRTRK